MTAYHLRYPQFVFFLGDLLGLNLAFFGAAYLRFHEMQLQDTAYYDYYVQLWVVVNLLWFLLSLVFKTYPTGPALEPRRSVGKTLQVYSAHLFLLLLLLVSLKKGEYSRLFITYFYLFAGLLLLPWHFFFLRFLRAWRRKSGHKRRIVLVGEVRRVEAFRQNLQRHPELGLQVVAVFAEQPQAGFVETESATPLETFLEQQPAEEIYVALRPNDQRYAALYALAEQHLLRFRLLPDWGLPPTKELQIDFYDQMPVISFKPEPLAFAHNRWLKRSFDVLISALVVLALYPWLIPLLALGVRLSGRGPIFFAQERSGYRGRVFTIYKLRSMRPNVEANSAQAKSDDWRITPFGRLLRLSHLDELPQFWQVLRGEMSVVGPRPHMLAHTEAYRQMVEAYMVRHWVKPGLTGLAQVNGLHGQHDLEHMRRRVEHDVYYLENWSLLLDLSILLRTPLAIFS